MDRNPAIVGTRAGRHRYAAVPQQSDRADVQIVATHGRTGFRRLALGSVAEAVVRRSRVPVLVLPLPKD